VVNDRDSRVRGISDKRLEWKGIEATIELARSQNAKVSWSGTRTPGCR
jgi:hypothetical protein